MLPTASENPTGLHARYIIRKEDGSPMDPRAEYFVLRIDRFGSDPNHIRACQNAALHYAQSIAPHIPELAANLRERIVDHIESAKRETGAPTVVCLCGSTRFGEAFRQANLQETLAGRIVLTVGCDFKSDDAIGLSPDTKERLDELHRRKIDLADEVLILNVDGYMGESTKRELAYARSLGKGIRFLEPENGDEEVLRSLPF